MIKAAQLCARVTSKQWRSSSCTTMKTGFTLGTAINTAHRIYEATGAQPQKETGKVPGRAGHCGRYPIHSVRLPGLIAHQEVIFGDEGQILTLRHDAMDRSCFMPGLLLAVRRAPANKDLIYGMENLLD